MNIYITHRDAARVIIPATGIYGEDICSLINGQKTIIFL